VLAKVREMAVPAMEQHGPIETWIFEDTPNCYQARGSHLIKRKINALFIIALLATSSSGTTRAHARPDHLARCRPPRRGTATLWRALNMAGETMFDSWSRWRPPLQT
jgi:hypothetical protein